MKETTEKLSKDRLRLVLLLKEIISLLNDNCPNTAMIIAQAALSEYKELINELKGEVNK